MPAPRIALPICRCFTAYLIQACKPWHSLDRTCCRWLRGTTRHQVDRCAGKYFSLMEPSAIGIPEQEEFKIPQAARACLLSCCFRTPNGTLMTQAGVKPRPIHNWEKTEKDCLLPDVPSTCAHCYQTGAENKTCSICRKVSSKAPFCK